MSILHSIKFILGLALISLGGVASAQAQMMMAPAVPQFMPVGNWNVEKTDFAKSRGLSGVRLPCMMAISYDNGYVLRFSGNTGQMLAMAIDFRQDVFVQGRKYPAQIGFNHLGGSEITATAFSKSTLIFNLRPIAGVYQQLQSSAALTLNVDGNAFVFALGNVVDSIARLESCFGPVATPIMNAGVNGVGEPRMPETKNWKDKVSPTVARKAPAAPIMMSWQAKAGDDLRATLQRWSSRAGVRVDWQSDRGGKVVSDIKLNGTFEQAVQLLMAQNATALGVDASMMGRPLSPQMSLGDPSPSQSTMSPQPITPQLRSNLPEPSAPHSRWSAPAGANLQLVLQKWSKDEGVDFVWQSHHEFLLKRPVHTSNSYEAALQAVLGQFSNEGIRPAAQLNNDPQTGQRILFVQSSRVL